MKPGPLHAVDTPDDADGSTVELPRGGFLPIRLGVTTPNPDDPLAVVAVGPAGAGRREVLAGLLELDPAMLEIGRAHV